MLTITGCNKLPLPFPLQFKSNRKKIAPNTTFYITSIHIILVLMPVTLRTKLNVHQHRVAAFFLYLSFIVCFKITPREIPARFAYQPLSSSVCSLVLFLPLPPPSLSLQLRYSIENSSLVVE